jgi:hypothetical protein
MSGDKQPNTACTVERSSASGFVMRSHEMLPISGSSARKIIRHLPLASCYLGLMLKFYDCLGSSGPVILTLHFGSSGHSLPGIAPISRG